MFKIKKVTFSIFILLALGCFLFLTCRLWETGRERILLEKRKKAWIGLRKEISDEIGRFKGEVGIVIRDLDKNWQLSYNKEMLFPSASLAKIPIMAGCFQAAQDAKLKLDRHVKLKSSDKFSGHGILKNMHPGVVFSVEELIGLMIYDSDNTATNIVTAKVGIDYLDNFFKQMGLKNTNLSRRIADYQSRDKGIENYTTAEDMADILEGIYRKTLINKDISEKCLRLLKLQQINDRIPKYLPVELTIAHKTGLEQGVCHDVGLVYTRKGAFIICVLTKHKNVTSVPSKEFIAKISLHTYNYFEQ
jgi:beta-lactamase class A